MKRFIRPSLLALLPVVAIFGAGITAFAHGARHGGHDPAKMKSFVDNRVNSELDELKATADQRTKITGIVDGFFTTNFKDSDKQHGEFRDAMASVFESGDGSAVEQLIDEQAAKKTAIAHQAVQAGLQIRAALTAEQRVQLAKDIREHKWSHKL